MYDITRLSGSIELCNCCWGRSVVVLVAQSSVRGKLLSSNVRVKSQRSFGCTVQSSLNHELHNRRLLVLQAVCDAVPVTPYLDRIQKVTDQMPIKALGNKPLGTGAVSNAATSSASDSGIAPSSGDAESGSISTEPSNEDSLFPGAFLPLTFQSNQRVCLRTAGFACVCNIDTGSWSDRYQAFSVGHAARKKGHEYQVICRQAVQGWTSLLIMQYSQWEYQRTKHRVMNGQCYNQSKPSSHPSSPESAAGDTFLD
jgi:hypothetical protein